MRVPDLGTGARAVGASVATLTERLTAISMLAGELSGELLARLPHPVPEMLTGITDTLGAVGEMAPVFSMQLDAVAHEVSAQRLSLQALSAELVALDAQLAVLERTLATARTWAHDLAAISTTTGFGRPVSEGPAGS